MNDLSNRVLVLERQLQEMQAELVSTRRMFVPQNSPRRVRIAKITQQPSSTGDKKFGVLFLNGEFDSSTLSPGAATFVDRSNETYQAVAYNLGGKDPSNGDKVFCFEIGDRWWFKVDDGSTTVIGGEAVSETMVLYNPRFWFTNGVEYAPTVKAHFNSPDAGLNGYRSLFNLSFEYIHNPQSWFEHDAVSGDPWNYNLTAPGFYTFAVTALLVPFRIATASPAPDPEQRMGLAISFDDNPISQCGLDSSLPHMLFAAEYPAGEKNTSSFSGSFTDPTSGSCDYISMYKRLTSERSGVVQTITGGPYTGKKMFNLRSVFIPAVDADYGIETREIEVRITRICPSDVWGSCPTAIA